MKQKKMYRIIAWIISISLMFQAAGITSFASEVEVDDTTALMQDDSTKGETMVSSEEEMMVEMNSETDTSSEEIETKSPESEMAEAVQETVEEINIEETVLETVLETESLITEEATEESISYNDVQTEPVTFEVDFLIYEVISESDRTVRLKEVNREDMNYYYYYENPTFGEDIEITVPSTVSNGGTTYSVIEIGDFAFADYTCDLDSVPPLDFTEWISTLCPNKITVSDGVKKIGAGAFFRMYQLKEVVLPDSVEEIGSCAFVLDEQRFVSGIGENPALLEVNIPKNVKFIGSYAYAGVTFEGTLVIPDGVETIGEYAFGWEDTFDNYSVVEVPASVTTIGKNAFHTSSLVKAVLARTTLPTLVHPSGENEYNALMFGENFLTNLLVHVPADLIAGYESSDLSYYVSGIEFKDIQEYTTGENTYSNPFHFTYNDETVTQIEIMWTETKTINVVMDNENVSPEDISWELILVDNPSANIAEYISFTDYRNGIITLEAKKIANIQLEGKVPGYAKVVLNISNVYITEEHSLNYIEKLASLTEEEIQPLSIVEDHMGTDKQIAEMRAKAEEIIQDCTTDAEKIFAIEQWIALHVAYDYDSFNTCFDPTNPFVDTPYQSYEVFCERYSVCSGYANLAETMIRSIGIPCVYISGPIIYPEKKSLPHAWNAAYDADNKRWIYFDATWDTASSLIDSAFESRGIPNTEWFDFDPVADIENSGRYISEMDMDYERLHIRFAEDEFLSLYVGETAKFDFYDDIEIVSIEPQPHVYKELDYDFYPAEEVEKSIECISIDEEGNITALEEGLQKVAVTGWVNGEKWLVDLAVRVFEKKDISFDKNTYTITLGENSSLKCMRDGKYITELVKMTSSDPSIVEVDEDGNLTSVACGTATITGHLYCNDTYTVSCEVVVTDTAMEDPVETIEEFEQDSLIYQVLTQPEGDTPGTVSLTGESFSNLESSRAITITIPESVEHEEQTYTVTQIGANAFSELIGEAAISIPASVETIEREAFYPAAVGTDLTGELILPENSRLHKIGPYAFAKNEKLTTVDLSNCTMLETIGEYAFYGCSYDSVTSDGELVGIGITEVILPENLKEIGSHAFYLCQHLTNLNIPKNMDFIGNEAFVSTDLSGVIDLSGVKNVGDDIFNGIFSIQGIILNDEWTAIPNGLFKGLAIEWAASESCLEEIGGIENIESGSVLLSENIKNIGKEAFESSWKIKSVQAPGVITVGKRAFMSCTGLENIDFEQNLTVIPEKAFMNCNAITEFTINSELSEIGSAALYGLSGLSTMRLLSDKIESFGWKCFSNNVTFYLPADKAEEYMPKLKSYAAAFYDLDGNKLENKRGIDALLISYPEYKIGDSYEVIRDAIGVYVDYVGNTFEQTAEFQIEEGNFTEGSQEITISYGDFTDTIKVGSSGNQKALEGISIQGGQSKPFKTGSSFQKVKNQIKLWGIDTDCNLMVLEEYDVWPGYFVEGENKVTISYCDYISGVLYKITYYYNASSDAEEDSDDPIETPEDSVDGIIKGLHVEFVSGGALELPKAGHIVSAQDIKVSHLVQTTNGMEYRETSDYTITGGELKRGDNTVIISSFDSEGNVITYEMFLYAEAKLDAFDVKLKDGVKLKVGDIIDTTMFIGTASYVGENGYTNQQEVEYFSLDGDMVVQEGENTFTFSYTEYTRAYGEITKYATWEMCTDDKPVLSTSTLNINQYAVTPVSFEVYVPFGMTPQLDGVFYQNNNGKVQSGISYTMDEDGACTVQIPTVMKNKTYKLYVKVTVKETENVYYLPIKLTLKTTLPKITASAEAMNLFFTDEDNRTSMITLKNPSAEEIRLVVFEENSSMDKYFDVVFDQEKQTLALKLTDMDVTKKDLTNKGNLLVYTENYNKPTVVNVKISISDKQPKLKVTPSSVTINTRLYDQKETSFEVTMQEGKAYVPVTLNGTAPELVTGGDLIDQISTEDNKVTISLKNTADFKKLKTVKVKVQAANWKNPVQISHKIKTVDVLPKAVLASKTLSLDMRAVGAETSTILRFDTKAGDITYNDLANTLTAVKNDATAPKVTLEKNADGTYIIKAAHTATMAKGTYKYEIIPELSDGTKLKKVTLSVKVTTAAKAANASLKAQKGSKIDLISRTSTKYVYTVSPTVKGTYIKNIVLKKVEVGNAAVPTTLFDVKINEQNGVVSTIEVSASEEGEFLSGKKYKLTFEIMPATDAQELNVAEVKVTVTPKESPLKLNANMKTAVLYRNIPYVKVVYKVTPKTAGIEIGKMEYIPSTGVPEGAFEIVQTDMGTYQIRIADKAKVKSGKTYKLNFKVQAEGATKTVTQKLTIKVQ